MGGDRAAAPRRLTPSLGPRLTPTLTPTLTLTLTLTLTRQHPDVQGEPLDWHARGMVDALAFDFAPSFNFRLDRLDFDPALRPL
jgi:hypothetical protein